MAITGSERLYAFQRHWFVEVLEHNDSLLTPGAPIWRVEHLDELQRSFVEQPDTTAGRSFLEKLRLQLEGTSAEAKQLMAELLIEHFLIFWVGAMSATSKLKVVETVLSWLNQPPEVPDSVREVMELGIVHPGQWALTRRDLQLTWLVQFCRTWLTLPAEERYRLRQDPWAMRDLTDRMTDDGTESARLALLHLTFPDTFEAIVSPQHKRLILQRFADAADDIADLDQQLLELRAKLGGPELDWYSDPMVHRWQRNRKKWTALLGWVRRIHEDDAVRTGERPYKVNLAARLSEVRTRLLAEDPSWLAGLRPVLADKGNNLTRWQDHGPLLDWLEAHPAEASHSFARLWAAEAEPLAAMADFLGLLPTDALGQAPGVRLNIASFLLMARDAEQLPATKITPLREAWQLAGWPLDRDLSATQVYARALALFEELLFATRNWPQPLMDLLDAQGVLWTITSLQDKPAHWSAEEWSQLLSYRGVAPAAPEVPEVADSEPVATSVDHLAEAAAELFVDRAFLEEIEQLLADKKQVILYGPPGTGKTYLARRLALALAEDEAARVRVVQFHPALSYEDFIEGLRPRLLVDGNLGYELVEGPLIRAAEAARADPLANHVLVIDEINRANLPKVLGELLFMLEYRDAQAYLTHRPDVPFKLPTNLLIIGTMNTADRSVAVVDAALRRRFHFVPFFPHEGPMRGLLQRWLTAKGGRMGIARFLDAVNQELIEQVGRHLLIGPSHFMQTDLTDEALRRIWDYNVFPLIEEQLWGRDEEIVRWQWQAVRERFAEHLGVTAEPVPSSIRE
ncbi:MAG TPA: AAA family ATPase [Jatrophihabitans sp.]|nr:AAA family ATPase [Jatrophihabitans sp.]